MNCRINRPIENPERLSDLEPCDRGLGGTGHWPVAAGDPPAALGAPATHQLVNEIALSKLGGKLPPRTGRWPVPPGIKSIVPAKNAYGKSSRRRDEADAWTVAGSNVRLVTSSATSSQSVQPVRRALRSAHGFTMVEIAIALGVIGFALVAIMGILPFGLEVQRDNRAETIINQDATFWIEAIRSGATGMDDLTNWVEQIYTPDSVAANTNYTFRAGGLGDFQFTYGSNIVSLLTTARAFTNSFTNSVQAIVTAISGAAAEKELNSNDRDVAFRYRLAVEILSYTTNALTVALTNAPGFELLNDPVNFPFLDTLHELRLTFSYPYTGRSTEPRRKIFRSTISRNVLTNLVGAREYYLFAQ